LVAGREIGEVLSQALSLSLAPVALTPEPADLTSMGQLGDDQVLALCELQLPTGQDQRLSELLDRQQAGLISEVERPELTALMQTYQLRLLRRNLSMTLRHSATRI
jgi:hypothetical protein